MVTEATTRRRATLATAVSVLVALYAVTFFVGGLLHLGVWVLLGFAVLAEPQILPATLVEGLCGLFLAVGAYAALTRRTSWAWTAITAAHRESSARSRRSGLALDKKRPEGRKHERPGRRIEEACGGLGQRRVAWRHRLRREHSSR